jgi:hypothetical protein
MASIEGCRYVTPVTREPSLILVVAAPRAARSVQLSRHGPDGFAYNGLK